MHLNNNVNEPLSCFIV